MSFWEQIPLISELSLDARVLISRLILFICVFLVFWLLRKAMAQLLLGPFRKLAERTNTHIDDYVLRTLSGVTSYIALALSILAGIIILDVSGNIQTFFERVAASLLLYALFKLLFDISRDVTQTQERLRRVTRIEVEREIMPIVRITASVVVVLFGLMLILQVWQVNIAGLLAGIGLGGLAISLAAKSVLDDILGFMVIMGDNLFNIDEYVISPHGEGIIEKIGIRSTHIRQLDQGLVIAPNSKVAGDSLTNWSRLEQRWFNFMLGVTYDSTADQIEDLAQRLRETLKARENVKPDSVVVLFTEYADSSLNLLVRCYVDIEDWTAAKEERHAVNLEIQRLVDNLDMSIAFPSRSLYVEQVPSGLSIPDHANGNGNGRSNGDHRERERVPMREGSRAERGSSSFHKGDPDPEIHDHAEDDGE